MDRVTAALATADGAPLLAELQMRESTTLPGRLKVTFTAKAHDGVAAQVGGDLKQLAPAADALITLCPEFRLEMN